MVWGRLRWLHNNGLTAVEGSKDKSWTEKIDKSWTEKIKSWTWKIVKSWTEKIDKSTEKIDKSCTEKIDLAILWWPLLSPE